MRNALSHAPAVYRKFPEKQVYRDRKQVSAVLERDWDRGVTAVGHEGIFVGVDGLELDCGDGCRTP